MEFWTLIFGGVRLCVSYAEPVTAASLESSDNKLWKEVMRLLYQVLGHMTTEFAWNFGP